MDELKIFYIYWDSKCQCELFRADKIEDIDEEHIGMFGGGNYNIYPCISGHHIVEVIGRKFDLIDYKTVTQELRIMIECDSEETK